MEQAQNKSAAGQPGALLFCGCMLFLSRENRLAYRAADDEMHELPNCMMRFARYQPVCKNCAKSKFLSFKRIDWFIYTNG